MFSTLIPTTETINEIDKISRAALWTKTFKGSKYGCVKIFLKILDAGGSAVGLGIPNTSS